MYQLLKVIVKPFHIHGLMGGGELSSDPVPILLYGDPETVGFQITGNNENMYVSTYGDITEQITSPVEYGVQMENECGSPTVTRTFNVTVTPRIDTLPPSISCGKIGDSTVYIGNSKTEKYIVTAVDNDDYDLPTSVQCHHVSSSDNSIATVACSMSIGKGPWEGSLEMTPISTGTVTIEYGAIGSNGTDPDSTCSK